MWKKTLTLAMACSLLFSQAAFAAGSEAEDSNAVNASRRPYGLERSASAGHKGLPRLQGTQALDAAKPLGPRLKELQELQQSDPEALKSKLLEAHTAMVARAQEVVDHKDTLAQELIAQAVERQTKALEQATKAAAEATDQALAQKRLEFVKAKQALAVAFVTKNAQQMADGMITQAEQVLANAASVRTRIENGEGLEVAKEWRQQRMSPLRGRHQQDPSDQEN